MKFISSTYFLRNLRTLDFFTLDLGESRRTQGQNAGFRKLDDVMVKYRTLYNTEIVKFGRIGDRIIFYEDVRLPPNKYIILKDDDIYELTYTEDDLVDLQDYILGVMMRIDELNESEDKMEEKKAMEVLERDMWVADDEKNRGKSYMINQRLTKDEYRKELEQIIDAAKKIKN